MTPLSITSALSAEQRQQGGGLRDLQQDEQQQGASVGGDTGAQESEQTHNTPFADRSSKPSLRSADQGIS
nr:hypothetical protein GCM10020092_032580 [Actinoplanes digitatis]